MKKRPQNLALLLDRDLNSNYLTDKLWAMINQDGKVDEFEREYFNCVQDKLKTHLKR